MKLFIPFLLSAMLIIAINSTGCRKDASTEPATLENNPSEVNPGNSYFPLSVGNKWTYEYSSESYDNSNPLYQKDSTISFNVDWEVIAYHPKTNTYDIQTRCSQGVKICTYTNLNTPPYTIKRDTTFTNPSTGMFQISVADSIIAIPGSSYCMPLAHFNINGNPGSADTLHINAAPRSIHLLNIYKFVKGVGLVYSGYGQNYYYNGYGYVNSQFFTLKSHKLKQVTQ
ncbi:MAG: hypothetical protein HF314_00720 [Ignavibacteria bacterium]|nr:hypothetical protein [Ignavibacteria bacterium]MCU7501573.1 hypothetical protein [Ignavibacteria bacterium]MCU7517110.1 hypothetical protein [Ignavibacteria bacterium]